MTDLDRSYKNLLTAAKLVRDHVAHVNVLWDHVDSHGRVPSESDIAAAKSALGKLTNAIEDVADEEETNFAGWVVGRHFFVAQGFRYGSEVDDAVSAEHKTLDDAVADLELKWRSGLSLDEREDTAIVVYEMEALTIENGMIGMSKSVRDLNEYVIEIDGDSQTVYADGHNDAIQAYTGNADGTGGYTGGILKWLKAMEDLSGDRIGVIVECKATGEHWCTSSMITHKPWPTLRCE